VPIPASRSQTIQTVEQTVEDQIGELAALYRFRQPNEVRAYLTANPDLLPLVHEAASKIPDFLAPGGELVLEYFSNPEEEDDVGLFAVVPTRWKHDEVQPGLNRPTREWLVDAGRTAGNRFNVGVEFR